MNTREMASEYRLTQWAEKLREQKRSGQTIREWCEAMGIKRQQYFYWQRKLREAACEELTIRESRPQAAPEGWALCRAETNLPALVAKGETTQTDQMAVEVNGLRITVGSGYPPEQLARLLRELVEAC